MPRQSKDIFISHGVNVELPFEHKLYLMNFLNDYGQILLDDFQIFEFYYDEFETQYLCRKQEAPEQTETYLIKLNHTESIKRKVWAIYNEGTGWVLVFPSEY